MSMMGHTETLAESLFVSGKNYCFSVVGNMFHYLLSTAIVRRSKCSCLFLHLWEHHLWAICFQVPRWGQFGQGPGCGFHSKMCDPQTRNISAQVPSSKVRIGGQRFGLQPQSHVMCSDPLKAGSQAMELQKMTDRLIKLVHIYPIYAYIFHPLKTQEKKERTLSPKCIPCRAFFLSDRCCFTLGCYHKSTTHCWRKQQTFISHNSGAGKCKIKVLEDSVSSESLLLGSLTAILLYPYMI